MGFSVLFEGESAFVGKQGNKGTRTSKAIRYLNTATETRHLGFKWTIYIAPPNTFLDKASRVEQQTQPGNGTGSVRFRLTKIESGGMGMS